MSYWNHIEIRAPKVLFAAIVAVSAAATAGTGAPLNGDRIVADALDMAKSPRYVYARPGDPLRIVWSVKGGRSMGIIGEGPLRARCFVMDDYYRELTLTGAGGECAERRVDTVEKLAAALDLEPAELPADLIRIWRDGSIDWQPYEPGIRVPVDGDAPDGPHRLVGNETYRVFVLAPGRGSLVVCYYAPGMTRALRIRAPKREHVIRPRVGLSSLIEEEGLVPSDIPRHLESVHAGREVDWGDIRGYVRY